MEYYCHEAVAEIDIIILLHPFPLQHKTLDTFFPQQQVESELTDSINLVVNFLSNPRQIYRTELIILSQAIIILLEYIQNRSKLMEGYPYFESIKNIFFTKFKEKDLFDIKFMR